MEWKLFLGRYLIWAMLLLGQLRECRSCIEKERKALLEINKFMISRSQEGSFDITESSLPTWNNDTKSDCCRWKGIECNRTSGRVIGLSVGSTYFTESSLLNLSLLHPFEEVRSLNLSYGQFNGFVDDVEGYRSLRRLRQLEILDLSSNSFKQSIFPFLNAATSLTSLLLHENLMGGPFPFKELKDLTNLEQLDLSDNGFNGSMPAELTHLKKLKYLDMSLNIFSSSMELQALQDLTNLELLILSGNKLNGPMPEFTHLKHLKTLDLSFNGFSSLVELQGLKDLTNLEMLNLRGNSLNASMLELTHLKKLKSLDLSYNGFSSFMELQVFCKMKNLRELNLGGNYFVGQLPIWLGSLNKLRVLDLSSNELSGNLPSSFRNLKSLEYLSVSENNFAGLFSLNSLANLTKLKVFKLSSRSRMIQVETKSRWHPKFQLSVVVLRFCNLKEIPSFLVYQKTLRLVDLSNNNLSGNIPTGLLANNPKLEVLQLQNNSFVIFQMPPIVHNLQVLDFSANHIGLFPDNIGRALPSLVHMNGSKNGFQGNFPSSIGEMKNLSFLDLSHNNFSRELPRSFITGCFSLKVLILSHNKLCGHFLRRETSFTSMEALRVDNNLFTGKIGVGLLSFVNTLQVLDMSNNCLTGAIPSWIAKLSYLRYLLVSNNFLEGTFPPSLMVMPYLSILDLSGNLFYGKLPSHVNNSLIEKILFLHDNNFTGNIPDTLLETVKILDLRNNELSGSIPQFVHTENINVLLLSGNKLTGSIPRHLCSLSNIRILDLSDNQLDGFIPSCLNNLSFGLGEEENMVDYLGGFFFWLFFQSEFYKSRLLVEEVEVEYYIYQEIEIKFASKQRYDSYSGRTQFSNGILGYMNGMDLSNNELSGVIPAELGGLSKLQVLNLSHNFLSSSIPSNFFNLKDIESLDLSHNMLQGHIPHQLTSLTSLAVFNVSYNKLSGIIPQGKQFNTFDENTYLGNPLLCGSPTYRSCVVNKSPEEANNGGGEDDEAAIEMLVFYFSVASSYVTTLIGILVFMCVDCPWRRAWLRIVDASIASAKNMLP